MDGTLRRTIDARSCCAIAWDHDSVSSATVRTETTTTEEPKVREWVVRTGRAASKTGDMTDLPSLRSDSAGGTSPGRKRETDPPAFDERFGQAEMKILAEYTLLAESAKLRIAPSVGRHQQGNRADVNPRNWTSYRGSRPINEPAKPPPLPAVRQFASPGRNRGSSTVGFYRSRRD